MSPTRACESAMVEAGADMTPWKETPSSAAQSSSCDRSAAAAGKKNAPGSNDMPAASNATSVQYTSPPLASTRLTAVKAALMWSTM